MYKKPGVVIKGIFTAVQARCQEHRAGVSFWLTEANSLALQQTPSCNPFHKPTVLRATKQVGLLPTVFSTWGCSQMLVCWFTASSRPACRSGVYSRAFASHRGAPAQVTPLPMDWATGSNSGEKELFFPQCFWFTEIFFLYFFFLWGVFFVLFFFQKRQKIMGALTLPSI